VMQLTSSLNHRNEGRRPSPLLVAVQRGWEHLLPMTIIIFLPTWVISYTYTKV
jgi:hypothetical protein